MLTVGGATGKGGPGGRVSRGQDARSSGPRPRMPMCENQGQGCSECSFLTGGSRKTTRRDKGIGGGRNFSFICYKHGQTGQTGDMEREQSIQTPPNGPNSKRLPFIEPCVQVQSQRAERQVSPAEHSLFERQVS